MEAQQQQKLHRISSSLRSTQSLSSTTSDGDYNKTHKPISPPKPSCCLPSLFLLSLSAFLCLLLKSEVPISPNLAISHPVLSLVLLVAKRCHLWGFCTGSPHTPLLPEGSKTELKLGISELLRDLKAEEDDTICIYLVPETEGGVRIERMGL